jgi:hypothetical protein
MSEQIELEDAIKETEGTILKIDTILDVIDKVTLGGTLEKMLFIIDKNKLEIKSDDGYETLYSIASMDNFLNVDSDFGIYNSRQFMNLLRLFNKKIKTEFVKVGNELDSILLKEDSLEIQVNLADPIMFNRHIVNSKFIKESKLPKEYEIFIDINSDMASKFIKIFDTFTDSKICFFHIKKNKLYLTVGDEKTRENSASILVSSDEDGYKEFPEKVSFLMSDFKKILKINKNNKINIKMSTAGIMIINVVFDDIKCKYYVYSIN